METTEPEKDQCPTDPGLAREDGFQPGFDWSYVKEHPEQNWHVIGWMACLFLLLVIWIVSVMNVRKHLKNYYDPSIQKHKLRVIMFPPVYATLAWFSYLRYDYATTIMFFATLFEAFAVFNLYSTLKAYLAPYREAAGDIKESIDVKIMFVYPFHLKSKWGMHYRILTDALVFQYPIWALIESFVSIFAELHGRYCEGSYSFNGAYVYIVIINCVSLSTILTALFTYLDVFHHEYKSGNIASHGMFWCVKGPIMANFYLGEVLLTFLTTYGVITGTPGVINPEDGTYLSVPWTADAVKNGLFVIIVCTALFIDCFLMKRYFGPDDCIKKAKEKGEDVKMTPKQAFIDGYIAYIPQFVHMVIGCCMDTNKLYKKRKELKKKKSSEMSNGSLLPTHTTDSADSADSHQKPLITEKEHDVTYPPLNPDKFNEKTLDEEETDHNTDLNNDLNITTITNTNTTPTADPAINSNTNTGYISNRSNTFQQ